MKTWFHQSTDISVSINISAHHLLHYDFVESLKSLIESSPEINPKLIELEVLETASIKSVSSAIKILLRCKALGISIALDDFGTGYSSLSYLKQLPLDVVKIDQSFVKNIISNEVDTAIIKSIVTLSEVLGYILVAEGIESAEHEAALIKMGCKYGQGFYISRPIDATSLIEWIKERNARKLTVINE